MTSTKLSLRVACSAAALMCFATTAPAWAQSAPQDEAAEQAGAAEIVVTAQKREERIIDVPVSVNAVGAEQIDRQRVYTLSDISRSVPSVGANLSIRGIATSGANRATAGAVAILLDGVDLGPPVVGQAQISNLFDVERIEVLSGPQGTLFGTTASAGVIQVVTKRPDPTQFELIGKGELAEGFLRQQMTANLPLSSNAALRVSVHNDETTGIVRNTISGQVPRAYDRGVRGRLLWEPTENLTVNLIADYNRGGGNSQPGVVYAIAPTASLRTRLAACGITASLSNLSNCPRGVNPITSRNEKLGFSGQIDLALGDHTLTSITAYRRHKIGDLGYNGPGGDSDMLSENILDTNLTAEDLKTFSQEIRLSSPGNQALEYTLGLYYFHKDQKDSVIQAGRLGDIGALLASFGLFPAGTTFGRITLLDIDQKAYAAFGQATYHVTDQLSLIAGARFTHDELSDVSRSLTNTTTPTVASYGYTYYSGFFLAPVNQSLKVDNFSWKLGAKYEFSRNLNAYFTATRGYKGPGVNDQASPPIALPIINPEIPMAYELGLKGALLDNRVLVTLALFHNKVKGFQTSVYVPPSATSPAGSFATGNAPFIISKGIDFNVSARVSDEFTFNGGVLYNRGTYADSFRVACRQGSTPGTTPGCEVTPGIAGGLTRPVPQLSGVPKWRLLLNGEYAKEVTSGVTLYTQADLTYESSIFAGTTPDPVLDITPKTLVNARIGVRATDRSWGLSVFVRNLLDTNFSRLGGDPLGGFNGGGGQSYWLTPARGATFGATVDFRL
jgi:iron complex outermembrane receptor protein